MDQRLIEHLIDLDSGETFSAVEILSRLNEQGIFALRRKLREAVTAYRKDPEVRAGFACVFCFQPVHISATKKKEHFFKHGKDMPDCPIKTASNYSLEEIRKFRYNGIQESPRHRDLKRYIAEVLKRTSGFSDVKEEAVIRGLAAAGKWRKPDVSGVYNDKRVVVEIQLSKEFLDVIIARENFYRDEQTYIMWIFDLFSEDGSRFTEKDIYFANKRNAFAITPESRSKTRECGAMVFLCHYQIPVYRDGVIRDEWRERLVTVDELTFDPDSYKVYYHDYDAAKARLVVVEKLDAEIRRSFEHYWINQDNRDVIPADKSWGKHKEWFAELRKRGLIPAKYSERVSFPEPLYKILNALYSLKYQRMIGYGYTSNEWVQLANCIVKSRQQYAAIFARALRAYGLRSEVIKPMESGEMNYYCKRVDEIKAGINRGDDEFAQDRDFNDLFTALFPELFIEQE